MIKILITGGSGFIGTNLIEYFLFNQNIELLSIDIEKPKISAHNRIWKPINICDKESVVSIFRAFQPEIVIHLAARTDLRGVTLQDYDANMSGVSNVLAAINEVYSVQFLHLLCMFANRGICPKTLKIMRLILFMERVKWKPKKELKRPILQLTPGVSFGLQAFGGLGLASLMINSFILF